MSRVAILIPCLLTGGTEVATLDNAKALTKLGYGVDVVVYFNEVDSAMLRTFQNAGISVHLLGLVRGAELVGAFKLTIGLLRVLWSKGYTLIWVQYMTPTLVPLLVARFFSRRLIAAVHVAAGHYSASGLRRLRWLARWWCTRFVCVSKTTAEGIFGDVLSERRLAERVKVLPNAIDMVAVQAASRRNWRKEIGLNVDVLIIGFVGRLAYNKGVDVLMRAAALVTRDHGNVHWVIVGDGVERARLEAFAKESGLITNTHFIGGVPREGVYAAMKGFDIAVVPSREEGFGLTALEAMACSVPVVASRVGALSEVVIEHETGLFFELESHADLAIKLASLLGDPVARMRLGTAGYVHAHRNYDLSTYRSRLAELNWSMS